MLQQCYYNEKDLMATQQKLQSVNEAATSGDQATSVVSCTNIYTDYNDDGYQ